MNKRIFLVLLLSYVGDQFYILFVSSVLLKLGYSALFVAGTISATILPNLFFGPKLGRYVDKSCKRKLHSQLTVSLAILVNILGFFVFFTKPSSISMTIILFLMISYNFLYSPLNSVLYQYIIPTLDHLENKSFIRWEKYQAIGTFSAALICFILIKKNLYHILLPLDGLSFLMSGLIIHKTWAEPKDSEEQEPQQNFINKSLNQFNNLLKGHDHKSVLIGICLATFAYIFAVDSHNYNQGILYLKQLNVPIEYISIIIAGFSVFNFAGSNLYEKFLAYKSPQKVHHLSLSLTYLLLLALAFAVSINLLWLVLAIQVILQIIEPIWSTTNTVLMRAQIKKNSYGEFFGYFRIMRSLVTSLGIFLFGVFQDQHLFPLFIIIGSALILSTLIYDLKNQRTAIKC